MRGTSRPTAGAKGTGLVRWSWPRRRGRAGVRESVGELSSGSAARTVAAPAASTAESAWTPELATLRTLAERVLVEPRQYYGEDARIMLLPGELLADVAPNLPVPPYARLVGSALVPRGISSRRPGRDVPEQCAPDTPRRARRRGRARRGAVRLRPGVARGRLVARGSHGAPTGPTADPTEQTFCRGRTTASSPCGSTSGSVSQPLSIFARIPWAGTARAGRRGGVAIDFAHRAAPTGLAGPRVWYSLGTNGDDARGPALDLGQSEGQGARLDVSERGLAAWEEYFAAQLEAAGAGSGAGCTPRTSWCGAPGRQRLGPTH